MSSIKGLIIATVMLSNDYFSQCVLVCVHFVSMYLSHIKGEGGQQKKRGIELYNRIKKKQGPHEQNIMLKRTPEMGWIMW